MLTVCGLQVSPGEKVRRWVPVTESCSGPLAIPMILVAGTQPGPTLYVQSGLHGDEYDGLEVVLRLADELDPQNLKGNVILVPRVNVPSFSAGARRNHIDYLDMNRVFPGRPDGFLAEQLAHFVTTELLPHADFTVDLHGGNTELEVVSYGSWESTPETDTFPVAKLLGVKHLWRWTRTVGMGGTFTETAAKQGVPSAMVELGGGNRWNEESVTHGMYAVRNVMRYLGMIGGAYEGLQDEVLVMEGSFVHARKGGFLRPRVKLEQSVRQGEVLAVVVNLLGEVVDEVTSPHDGVVNDIRSMPRIQPGEWLYLVGNVVERVPVK